MDLFFFIPILKARGGKFLGAMYPYRDLSKIHTCKCTFGVKKLVQNWGFGTIFATFRHFFVLFFASFGRIWPFFCQFFPKNSKFSTFQWYGITRVLDPPPLILEKKSGPVPPKIAKNRYF